jgi:hypothetical protein
MLDFLSTCPLFLSAGQHDNKTVLQSVLIWSVMVLRLMASSVAMKGSAG